jgi:hypothetical protein
MHVQSCDRNQGRFRTTQLIQTRTTQPGGSIECTNLRKSLFIPSTHHPHRSQELRIDIIGEDNKMIIHHKVAARVVCVFSKQDALIAACAEQHQKHQLQRQHQRSQYGAQNLAASPSLSSPSGSAGHPSQTNGSASFSFAQGSIRDLRWSCRVLGEWEAWGAGIWGRQGQADHILSDRRRASRRVPNYTILLERLLVDSWCVTNIIYITNLS